MKTLSFFITIILFTLAASCQSKGSITLYAYKQSVSGGKRPEQKEGTGPVVSNNNGTNYFVYATSPSRIYPSEIWLQGNCYGVNLKAVAQTPVEYKDEANVGSPPVVLVPQTTRKVFQIIPNSTIPVKSASSKAKTLSKTHEVVLLYKMNGAFYYHTRKTLNEMEGAAM